MISKPKNIAAVLVHLLQLILYGAAHVTWQIKGCDKLFLLLRPTAHCGHVFTGTLIRLWAFG